MLSRTQSCRQKFHHSHLLADPSISSVSRKGTPLSCPSADRSRGSHIHYFGHHTLANWSYNLYQNFVPTLGAGPMFLLTASWVTPIFSFFRLVNGKKRNKRKKKSRTKEHVSLFGESRGRNLETSPFSQFVVFLVPEHFKFCEMILENRNMGYPGQKRNIRRRSSERWDKVPIKLL